MKQQFELFELIEAFVIKEIVDVTDETCDERY